MMHAIGSDIYQGGTLIAQCTSEADAQHLALAVAEFGADALDEVLR